MRTKKHKVSVLCIKLRLWRRHLPCKWFSLVCTRVKPQSLFFLRIAVEFIACLMFNFFDMWKGHILSVISAEHSQLFHYPPLLFHFMKLLFELAMMTILPICILLIPYETRKKCCGVTQLQKGPSAEKGTEVCESYVSDSDNCPRGCLTSG